MQFRCTLWTLLLCLIWSTADASDGAHAHHHPAHLESKVSAGNYAAPAVQLLRDDGKYVALRDELDDGRAVLLSFIYTDCTAVCPLVSRTLAEFQGMLDRKRDAVHIVSISIDPEQDTPTRLRDYAQRYGAEPGWQHYTGTTAASIQVQQAFEVYHGDKMNHTPVFFLRKSAGTSWVRLDGFVTAAELFEKYRGLDQ
ncbi:SCO family protein [Ferriphaselus sp. R-1]|uniref:SCO family protein n=1 Tax=Ferriphaselus sp. R-1 TaxID=1485544 RepID=UPI00054E1A41|nr:SCO family protein [Ferriphaselus sp. R-1]